MSSTFPPAPRTTGTAGVTVNSTQDRDEGRWVSAALERLDQGHGRNDTGFWLAVQLRDDGLNFQTAEWHMRQFVDGARPGDHPYTESEALASLRSAYRTPPRSPAGYDPTAAAPRKRLMRPWPILGDHSLHGLAGDVVGTLLPHSEADPAALLVQFLAMYGNAIGRSAHWRAEADEHYGNLFVMLVGRTAKGRKGTSLGQIKRLFTHADPEWLENRSSGLSTGEGLINAVRDPSSSRKAVRDENRMLTGEYEEVPDDPGVSDKRLLVVQTEFAGVLKVMSREGNNLSAILREAWDSGHLRVLTRATPLKATDAHVSIIGHITVEELKKSLKSTDASNGFANRFLWVCTERSKSLPEGGSPEPHAVDQLRRRVSEAIRFGAQQSLIIRDPAARERWRAVYDSLSSGRAGLFGFVTGRAEAQVMRLAMLYALADGSPTIGLDHLDAALGLWSYVEDSSRFIFGDSVGDKEADQLLRALRAAGAEGLTRTKIMTEVFGRNAKSVAIEDSLTLLHELQLAFPIVTETGGRPAEVWYAAGD